MTINDSVTPQPMPVSAKEYSAKYSLINFINAYYQIRDCMQYSPSTILIVGVGVGLEAILLREKFGLQVSTFDIDPGFKSDYVGSVHSMEVFRDQQFDVCIVSHVLEHLPFKYFEPSLKEVARIAKHAIVYLPYGSRHLEVKFIRAQREKEYSIKCTIPRFKIIDGTKPELCGGEHYWECGYRNFEVAKIKALISNYFILDNIYHNDDWHFSLNFCLTSKSD